MKKHNSDPKGENKESPSGKKTHRLTGRPRPQEVKDKISKAHKGKPKNYPSYLKEKTGKDHPCYKHGKGANRIYDPEKTRIWIMAVKRATNYKCFITGKDNNLECHHLVGFAYEPTRYLPENGVAICKEIHQNFHNVYGRGGNLPEQFEKYCREKYNITTFPWRQGNHKPSLLVFQENLVSGINQRAKEFEEVVKNRGHRITEGTFVNNSSIFTIQCLKHNTLSEVKVQRYKDAAFGVDCCSKEKQADTVRQTNKTRKK